MMPPCGSRRRSQALLLLSQFFSGERCCGSVHLLSAVRTVPKSLFFYSLSVVIFKRCLLKDVFFFNSGPTLLMKEAEKTENEKWVSKESVMMAVTESAGLPTGGSLQMQDGSHLSDSDQSESR